MTRRFTGLAAIVACATVSIACPVAADETGFASAHNWRKERGLTCMSDHWHYGNSTVQPTKARAQRDAISSWASFTAFEYGSNWARWGKAGSKKSSCSNSAGGWTCNVEARPCR